MPKHDGWAAMLPTGRLIGSTFAVKRIAALAYAQNRLKDQEYKLIRVKLTPSDPPRRDR